MHMSRQDRIRSFLTPSLEDGNVTINLNMAENELAEKEEEIQQAEAEADANEDDALQLEESHAALEAFADEVRQNYDNGGMSPATARMLARNLEFHYNRLGVEHKEVSLEDFAEATTRREVTRVSLESIGEKINKVWEALKLSIKKAIAYLVDFFARVFGGFKSLKERAMRIKEAADKVKSTKTGKVDFSAHPWITVHGKADPKKASESALKALNVIYGDYKEYLTKVYDVLGTELGQKGEKPDAEISEAIRKSGLGLPSGVVEYISNGVGVMYSGFMVRETVGGNANSDTVWKIPYATTYVEKGEENSGNKIGGEMETLSPQDIVATCKAVVALCETALSKKSVIDGLKKSLEEMIDKIDAADKRDGANFMKRAANRHAMKMASPRVTAVFGKLNNIAFRVARAACWASEESLDFHLGK